VLDSTMKKVGKSCVVDIIGGRTGNKGIRED